MPPSQNGLPPVQNLSDFLFVIWQQMTGNNPLGLQNLNWIVRHNIRNAESNQVASYVFHKYTGQPYVSGQSSFRQWPGSCWVPNDISSLYSFMEAMLGSPNGYAAAFMLWQHRDALGLRTVLRACMFADDSGQLSFAFQIGKIPASFFTATALPPPPIVTTTNLPT